MASTVIKNLVNRLNPMVKSYYRILFNLISAILLFPVLYVYFKLPNEVLFDSILAYEIAGLALVILGTYILVAGFKNYRTDEFIGTYQIKNHHEFHPAKLSRNGWNAVVRHPLYFGGILLAIGLLLITPTIKLALTSFLTITYLYIGTIWEEKKLVNEFGDSYREYQREVSMLIPIKWLLNKLLGKF